MIGYKQIRNQTALRANQLTDAVDAVTLEAAYMGQSAFAGMEVPATALKQAILAAEKRIASVIGRTKNPVLRRSLYGRSADIASGGLIPATDNTGREWLGAFGAVVDSTTNEPLTELTKQEIARLNQLFIASILKIKPHYFALSDMRLFHTRTNAFIEGCSWDYTAQSTEYDLLSAEFTFLPADVNTTTDIITKTLHGLSTGQRVRVSSTTTLPATLIANTNYFVIAVSANTFKLASSSIDAANNAAIDLTSAGAGTHSMLSAATGLSPLPQEVETFWIADVLANLSQENWFIQEAGMYAQVSAKCEADILTGVLPQAVLPDSTATVTAVKN